MKYFIKPGKDALSAGPMACTECGKVAFYHIRKDGYCAVHREVAVKRLNKRPWIPASIMAIVIAEQRYNNPFPGHSRSIYNRSLYSHAHDFPRYR